MDNASNFAAAVRIWESLLGEPRRFSITAVLTAVAGFGYRRVCDAPAVVTGAGVWRAWTHAPFQPKLICG